jgi:hypothetical protein
MFKLREEVGIETQNSGINKTKTVKKLTTNNGENNKQK